MTVLNYHTDEALIADKAWGEEKGVRWPVVLAEYLLPLPAEHRGDFVSLATVITNRSPGYCFSDGLYVAGTIYNRGGVEAVRARVEALSEAASLL